MNKVKTPITYWGGKQMLSPLICSLIPTHITYCEPFFGGGAVFFSKPPSKVEIINDLNREVVNFYNQVKSNFEALQSKIRGTAYSRGLYKDAVVIYNNPHLFSDLDRAWAFYIATNQGFSWQIGSWGFGTAGRSCEKKFDNQRILFAEDLRDRLDQTQIECSDALYLLKLRDRPDTFFYLDPPYFNSDCAHYAGYTIHQFEDLLRRCEILQGKFLLSSYPSDVLKSYTEKNSWYQIELEQKTSASKSRKIKTEVLTSNYPIALP